MEVHGSCIAEAWPGEFHGQRSLAGYSPLGCKESDMIEVTVCTHICIMYVYKCIYIYVHILYVYAGQEVTARTGHGTTDWFQIGKGVRQGCVLSPCLFNLYAEYIMRNTGLDEAQAGIKIAGRNINNLIYTDDTTLMAEREEEVKSLLMKVKEESEKPGLKLNIQKKKIMASGPSHFMANRWGNSGNSERL